MLDRSCAAFLPSQRYTLSTGDAAMNLGRFGEIDVICGKKLGGCVAGGFARRIPRKIKSSQNSRLTDQASSISNLLATERHRIRLGGEGPSIVPR